MKMLKKQTCLVSLLIMALVFMVSLTSCGEDRQDEPEMPESPEYPDSNEELFENLYGYWINTDKSGAMHIEKYDSEQCKVTYYVYSEHFPNNYVGWESYYSGYSIRTLAPYDESISGCAAVYAKIGGPRSYNRIVLINNNDSGHPSLSSYIFTRATEDEFLGYLQNGGGSEARYEKK